MNEYFKRNYQYIKVRINEADNIINKYKEDGYKLLLTSQSEPEYLHLYFEKYVSIDELKDDEYGIVYAAGGGDFHFGRYEDGVWTHKRGKSRIEEVDCEDDVFGKRYNSKRFYFAMKKGEVRYEC